jgi:hypothetical protein
MSFFTPSLEADIVFSFTPPIAKTFPLSEISPVIAKSYGTDCPSARLISDVVIVMPWNSSLWEVNVDIMGFKVLLSFFIVFEVFGKEAFCVSLGYG